MNTYLLIKSLHIVSSVLLVGTGFGSAFYMAMTRRSGNVQAMAVVSRIVVLADWCFTTPTVILQPLTGVAMVHQAGWPWTSPWLVLALALYVLAGLCWLPVVALQLRMARQAQAAAAQGTPLPDTFQRDARLWEALGWPAFLAMGVVYYLMVNKPTLWGG